MNYNGDEDILPSPDTAIEYQDNTEEEEGDEETEYVTKQKNVYCLGRLEVYEFLTKDLFQETMWSDETSRTFKRVKIYFRLNIIFYIDCITAIW